MTHKEFATATAGIIQPGLVDYAKDIFDVAEEESLTLDEFKAEWPALKDSMTVKLLAGVGRRQIADEANTREMLQRLMINKTKNEQIIADQLKTIEHLRNLATTTRNTTIELLIEIMKNGNRFDGIIADLFGIELVIGIKSANDIDLDDDELAFIAREYQPKPIC